MFALKINYLVFLNSFKIYPKYFWTLIDLYLYNALLCHDFHIYLIQKTMAMFSYKTFNLNRDIKCVIS